MEILQGIWKQHLRPRAVVGYAVKIFLPSPPNYQITWKARVSRSYRQGSSTHVMGRDKSLVWPSQGFWGIREHGEFELGKRGTKTKFLREQGNINAENKFGSNFGNKGTSTPLLVPPWWTF